MLCAVTLSALVLAMALGVSDIAFRELQFGTSARDTNEAFFAADIGYECALYYDQPSTRLFPHFTEDPSPPSVPNPECAGYGVVVFPTDTNEWEFTLHDLGQTEQACAKVTVDKSTPNTIITSNGYNVGNQNCEPVANSVERQLEITYRR